MKKSCVSYDSYFQHSLLCNEIPIPVDVCRIFKVTMLSKQRLPNNCLNKKIHNKIIGFLQALYKRGVWASWK